MRNIVVVVVVSFYLYVIFIWFMKQYLSLCPKIVEQNTDSVAFQPGILDNINSYIIIYIYYVQILITWISIQCREMFHKHVLVCSRVQSE